MNLDPLRDELDAVAARLAWRPRAAGDGAPWVLFGSAVLLLWGLRDRVGDVDVFVAAPVWHELERAGWVRHTPDPADPPFLECYFDELAVHAFYAWTDSDPEVDARQCRRAAELVHGWPCTPLQIIRTHKAMALGKLAADPRRAKHAADVVAIDRLFALEALAA